MTTITPTIRERARELEDALFRANASWNIDRRRELITTALSAVQAETVERCAKVCEIEAEKRYDRAKNPLPGDEQLRPFPQDMVQSAKGVTATLLAEAIRALAPAPGQKEESMDEPGNYDPSVMKGTIVPGSHVEQPAPPDDTAMLDYTSLSSSELLGVLSDDAREWARAFCQIAKKLGHDLDEGWMIGWFANAIERSSDVRRPAAPQWRPIESAPKDGTWILGVNNRGNCAVIIWAKNVADDFGNRHDGWIHPFTTGELSSFWNGGCGSVATHWIPLPTPPRAGGEGG